MENKDIYTLFVGAMEVNDYLLTLKEAQNLKHEYEQDGYTDAVIVNTENDEVV